MSEVMKQLITDIQLTGEIRSDVIRFLSHHGRLNTIDHSIGVADEARRLAMRFGEDARSAEVAGLLHDISVVFPREVRVKIAEQSELDILTEEYTAPILIHQRLSAIMARELFGIQDHCVLSAIACHTTLKPNASRLDKVVFVADKIAWDQPGNPPYLEDMISALERSLDQAALCYLRYMWQRRDTLPAVHPWLVDAYRELSELG